MGTENESKAVVESRSSKTERGKVGPAVVEVEGQNKPNKIGSESARDARSPSAEAIDFSLEDAFPDAEAIFSFVPERLEKVLGECLFVFDTNVLLRLYEVENTNLSAIRDKLGGLRKDGRLVIPARVAREFAKHRGGKIASLHEELRKQKQSIPNPAGIEYPLLKALPNYKELSDARDKLKSAAEGYQNAIDNVLDKIEEWHWDDPVGTLYRELFGKDVVRELPLDREKLEKEWPERRRKELPPGYKDKSPGDLIIWRTILDLASEKKKHVAFVCGDEKADWRVQDETAERQSRAKLYPRYELMEEFRRASGGRTFYLLRLSEVLKLLGAPPSAVEDVRKVEAMNLKAHDVPAPKSPALTGEVRFNYSSYNGRYRIGEGNLEFETRWSKASNTSIYCYNDSPTVRGVALAPRNAKITDMVDVSSLDFTSRVRNAELGRIVVLQNSRGFYAALEILGIKDDTRGDPSDELHFRYWILPDGTKNFAPSDS